MDNEQTRERQRFEHLVLGKPRPRAPEVRGRSGRNAKRRKPPKPIALADGVEERVAIRERWSHKQGTPETHEHAAAARMRPGSLARLFESGTIDKDQLAAADQIAEAYRAITADVRVRTASLKTRVDGGGFGRAEQLAINQVHADLAYTWWRDAVGPCADALLQVIVHDVGLTVVARGGGFGMIRARRMLTEALDLWRSARRRTARHAALIAG